MSASTDKIYSLCVELRSRIGDLRPTERRTAYAQLLTELLHTAEDRLREERYMDAEKSRSRCD
jgi:hypothetical protein